MHPPDLAVPVGPGDHTLGPDDAPVTLLEYADYECPYCRMAQPVIERLTGHFGARLRYVFRHYPLRMHPRAQPAAEAAEAAGSQGKFWEMHERLFAGKAALADVDFLKYAAEIGLDTARFERDLASGAGKPAISASKAGGNAGGVEGTPQFYINGYRYDGEAAFEPMRDTIEDALAYGARQ